MNRPILFSSFQKICWIAILLFFPGNTVWGHGSLKLGNFHPNSLVEAEVYVTQKKLTMRLKCFAEDLQLLQGVEPYTELGGKYDNEELKDGTNDHAKYLLEKIKILDADGNRIEGKVTEITHFEVPEEGISDGQLMNYSIGYVMEYTYEEAPEFITFNQQMVAEGALVPSELKILMKQEGSDVPYVKVMKPDMPETFQFDWDAPPLKSDASEEDWNSWFDQQRDKNLGIESYGSVYSFLYITPRDVRHEILIPLASLASMIEIESPTDGFLDIPYQDSLKPKIKALFSASNPIKIDGYVAEPKFDRIDFYGLDIRDFAMQADRRSVSMASGRVGVIMSYSTGTPHNVSLQWDLFNEVVRSVDMVAFEFDEIRKVPFTKFVDNNNYQWTAPKREDIKDIRSVPASFNSPALANFPWVSALLVAFAGVCSVLGWLTGKKPIAFLIAGVATTIALVLTPWYRADVYMPGTKAVDLQQADEIFATVHENLFRSFDFVEERDIYDALKKSVDGKLLRELYLDLNNSLKIKEQGGAVAVIEDVELTHGELVGDGKEFPAQKPGFSYRCQWDLVGTIEHWGHVHQRTNKYDVVFDVQAVDQRWKITGMRPQRPPVGTVKQMVRKLK